MKTLYIVIIALGLMAGLFFYVLSLGYSLAQKDFLAQSQKNILLSSKKDKQIKKKYTSQDYFPNLWKTLCADS